MTTRRTLRTTALVAAVTACLAAASPSQAQPTHDAPASVRAAIPTDISWFTDPLSATQRRAEVAVPRAPWRLNGGRARSTVATLRTHAGDLAVPASQAVGHELVPGQALTFTTGSLFGIGSARLTPHARTLVTELAPSLSGLPAITCEGYADYGNGLHPKRALSERRAVALCRALAAGSDVATRSVGYGASRPVVVGSTNARRDDNRRVVLVARTAAPAAPVVPVAPGITQGDAVYESSSWIFHLSWTTPDSGGAPITGYEWSLDGTTWTAFTDYVAGSPDTGSFDPQVSVCGSGTVPVSVRAVNGVGPGPASAAYGVSYGFARTVAHRC